MKKIKIIVCVLALLMLAGCSEADVDLDGGGAATVCQSEIAKIERI